MENQIEFTNLSSESSDQGAADGLLQAGWEKYWEKLDLGLFFTSSQDRKVTLNPTLREWLGILDETLVDETAFWAQVSSLAVDPARASWEIKDFLDGWDDRPLIQFPLGSNPGQLLSIYFFSLTGQEPLNTGYGGFLSKQQQSDQRISDLVRIYDNLLAPARQLSAAVQGNLQALSGNFQAWSPEVLDQFLDDARDDIKRMAGYLDLGLTYSNLIHQTSTFYQPVALVDLLEEIITEQGYITLKINEIPSESGNSLQVKIDQAMVKNALEILLKEVVERNPVGQQLELRLSEKEGAVLLNLENPRMLPLPGLAADSRRKEKFDLNPELYLANEILAAQGGKLVIERRQADEGGGLDIEVSLPVAEAPRQQTVHQDWRDLLGRDAERILLAEAQPEYQIRIRDALTALGYRVDLAVDGSTVLDLIQTRQPKLVILARNLPGMDGLLVTQGVRRWSAVPIIMISMRDSMDDRLYAYRLGVDDYLLKPFLIDELLAKVRVFLSRQGAAQSSIVPDIFHEGSIRIDHSTRQVWVRGDLVMLTPIEYNLLVFLSRQGRQIIPYEQLLENVWEGPEKGTRQGLFVHVRRLREKIEEDPKNPQIIGNKWGVGYVFNP